MKEVTEWNGKPRWMWCWDDNEHDKCKEYVVCVMTEEEMKECGGIYPVCTYDLNYKHCAEIEEEPTKQPCTREDLIAMLIAQGVPMLKWNNNSIYLVDELFQDSCKVNNVKYTYAELCAEYTLLNGNALWVTNRR